jgi:hypothetical protein
LFCVIIKIITMTITAIKTAPAATAMMIAVDEPPPLVFTLGTGAGTGFWFGESAGQSPTQQLLAMFTF